MTYNDVFDETPETINNEQRKINNEKWAAQWELPSLTAQLIVNFYIEVTAVSTHLAGIEGDALGLESMSRGGGNPETDAVACLLGGNTRVAVVGREDRVVGNCRVTFCRIGTRNGLSLGDIGSLQVGSAQTGGSLAGNLCLLEVL